MANFGLNQYGAVITLDHDEVQYALNAADFGLAASALVTGITAIPATMVSLISAAVAAYFKAEHELIKNADQGNGVYLTIPYPAIYLGQWWIIVPGSRPVFDDPWGHNDSGDLRDEDFDVIRFQIEHNAVGDSNAVEFVLNSAGQKWKKELVLDDGMGGSFTVTTDGPKTEDRNGLYMYQLPNGHLTFRKAKFGGVMWDVLELETIAFLLGGDRVTFYWEKD